MAGTINGSPIVLGTSLAPVNIEKQVKSVKSWIDNGFYVISCNPKEEIEMLKESFTDIPVEFVEIKRTAEEICGKKLPYVQDILDVASRRAEKVCGFINSDIMFSHMPERMYDFILNEASKSIIFGRRYEINQYIDIESMDWEINFDGIDFFFIDTHLAHNFYNDDFYVQSGWDLCILIKCKLLGIKIKELVNPIAFHVRHKIKWDFKETGLLVKKFMKKYFNLNEQTYSNASDMYYRILYEDIQQICFCNSQKNSCLFVLEQNNDKTVKSINSQEYLNKEIHYSDNEKELFDIVFYIYGELVLNKIFCKLVVYIMETFDCRSLKIGKFFISEMKGRLFYNQLSRNLEIVKKINTDSDTLTNVIRKKGKKEGILYLPVSHEIININDLDVVNARATNAKAYIMPAGVRAGEWYDMNKDRISWEIVGYIDNDINKVGGEIAGKHIYSIDILENKREKVFVIVASKYYSSEIEKQLSRIIDKSKIINANYIISLNSDANFSYFNFEKYMKNRNKIYNRILI